MRSVSRLKQLFFSANSMPLAKVILLELSPIQLLFHTIAPLTTIVSEHCTYFPLPQLPSLTSLDFSQRDADPSHNYLPSRRLRSVAIVISPQPKISPHFAFPSSWLSPPSFTVAPLLLWLSPFLSVWLLTLINGSLPLPLMSPLSTIVSPYRCYVYPLTSAALGVFPVDFISFLIMCIVNWSCSHLIQRSIARLPSICSSQSKI